MVAQTGAGTTLRWEDEVDLNLEAGGEGGVDAMSLWIRLWQLLSLSDQKGAVRDTRYRGEDYKTLLSLSELINHRFTARRSSIT